MGNHDYAVRCGALLLAAFAISGASHAQQPTSAPATSVGDDVKLRGMLDPEFMTITAGEQPLLRYRRENGPKQYVKELYTPGGVQVLLDSPPDHVHHRGLMFAIAVDGVDFWAEGQETGRQVAYRDKPIPYVNGDRGIGFVEDLRWHSPANVDVLSETRRVDLSRAEERATNNATLLTWQSRLELPPARAEAQLTGSHYFGLGMRFVRSMDKTGHFITAEPNAAGELVRGDERLYPGRWCAYTASVGGTPVTVAMFDGPNNIRPATWFTMKDPFAYLSATLKLQKEPLTLKAGSALELTYGVAAWDGEIQPQHIEQMYQTWLKLIPKTPLNTYVRPSTRPADTKSR